MGKVDELIIDVSLKRLMRHHFQRKEGLEFDLAEKVKALAPTDQFTISQYLLGLKYFEERIAAVFGHGEMFLDVGCGGGNWTIAGSTCFQKVLGLDINENRLGLAREMAKHLSKENRALFSVGAADKLPLGTASVDAILCNNVMAVMSVGYAPFLRELRRVIRNEGKLYLTVTDSGYLVYLFMQALENPSVPRLFSQYEIVWRNVRYILRLTDQPYAWIKEKYITRLAKDCGWNLTHSGPEGGIAKAFQPPIFRSRFAGLPFMKEYLFRPI